ncbi:hypothetical protein AQY21_00450 [Paracoccus sp. MKU1]|nr:hypothetical protein AQY21_00450 [Paracoccus sp. MKU1]
MCHPFAFRIEPRDPPAGVGILDVAQPVPDEAADIELVVEDAGTAFAVAVDRRRPPFPAHRAGHALAVQRHGDGARGEAAVVIGEDSADDGGLRFVDRAVAADRLAMGIEALHHVVAVGVAAAGLAVLDPAAQAPAGLVGQVLDEQRIHRALQPDVKLADLALRQREHFYVGIAHALVDPGDVLLVAADPVQRLGQHHVEAAARGIHDQGLEAGTLDHAGAGDGMVGIFLDHLPALLLGP